MNHRPSTLVVAVIAAAATTTTIFPRGVMGMGNLRKVALMDDDEKDHRRLQGYGGGGGYDQPQMQGYGQVNFQQQVQGGGGPFQPYGGGYDQQGPPPPQGGGGGYDQGGGNNGGGGGNDNNNNNFQQGPPPPQQGEQQLGFGGGNGGGGPPPLPGQGGAPGGGGGKKCQIRPAREFEVTPSWLASYPGTGAKLFWQAVQGITGITTGNDEDSGGGLQRGKVVGVKTHYPSAHVSEKFFIIDTSKLKTGILMLRNPIDLMPSYFRFIYQKDMADGVGEGDGGSEPTIEQWVSWRNDHLMDQVKAWSDHTKWWLDRYAKEDGLLVVTHEALVDPDRGPNELRRMAVFLNKVDPRVGGKLVPEKDLWCVWKTVVKDTTPEHKKPELDRQGIPKKNQPFQMRFPFTMDLLDGIMKEIMDLKKYCKGNQMMEDILKEFVKRITIAKRHIQKLLDS